MDVSPEALKVVRSRIRNANERTPLLVSRRVLLDRKRINWRFFSQHDAEMLAFVERRIRLCDFQDYLLGGPPLHRKHGFDPNQPRVPAGSPDGGQWTDGSEVISPLNGVSTPDGSIQLAGDISGFTRHGINQIISRGISPSAIHDAIVRPLQILPQANGTVRYVGSGAVVVVNPGGQVVTAWPR